MRWPIAALVLVGMAASACAPRARMCTAASECDAKSACVAGRCQLEKGTVRPAVEGARRIVVRPVDVAFLKSGGDPTPEPEGGGAASALPPVFALGKDRGKLFLKFEVTLPSPSNVVEAYVVLHRSSLVDDDPTPVSIHATRIVESWRSGSMSWAFQPRSTELRLPSTTVEPGTHPLVRLDVRELVRQWVRRDPRDQGIAIVAENETPTGMTFALTSDVEPYLELYLR